MTVADANDAASPTIACPHCNEQTSLQLTDCAACGRPLDIVDPQWSAGSAGGATGASKVLMGIGCAVLVVIAAGVAFFVACLAAFNRF